MQQPSLNGPNGFHDLCIQHINRLTEHAGGELRGLCPFHDDQPPSWSGSRRTGLWRCFGCGAHGNAQQFAERLGERKVDGGSAPRPARASVAACETARDWQGRVPASRSGRRDHVMGPGRAVRAFCTEWGAGEEVE